MADGQPQTLKFISPVGDIPLVHASVFQNFISATEYTLLIGQVIPQFANGVFSDEPATRIVSQVVMSPQAAAELHALLGDALASYEAGFGKIDTPFLASRRGA